MPLSPVLVYNQTIYSNVLKIILTLLVIKFYSSSSMKYSKALYIILYLYIMIKKTIRK